MEIKDKAGTVLLTVDSNTLQDADLRYANLQDADLRYVDLQGADLQDANLYIGNRKVIPAS